MRHAHFISISVRALSNIIDAITRHSIVFVGSLAHNVYKKKKEWKKTMKRNLLFLKLRISIGKIKKENETESERDFDTTTEIVNVSEYNRVK